MRLSAEGLFHAFPGRPPLFTGLDVSVSAGELVALSGPSGSGKSTLLAMLGGYERPQQGRILREDVRRIGWVFQNPIGIPRRTALDHLTYPLLTHGARRSDAEREAFDLLDRFALSGHADTPFRNLSGGEAQRLMLARAVASDFDALLVDEPTAQLDPQSARTVIDVIRGVTADQRITLLATHDPRLLEQCDRVITLGGLP